MTSITFKPDVEVVVTGASGFIGQAVCRELTHRAVAVYGLSRKPDFAISGVKCINLSDYETLPVPTKATCIHLAGEMNPRKVEEQMVEERNESLRIARAIAAHGFSRVVFASSAYVYGDQIEAPRREEETPQPRGAYAKVKYELEQLFLKNGYTVARIANTYGKGASPATVIPGILAQLSRKGDLKVYDATPIRDFINVNDVARGLVDLTLCDAAGVFNLGTGQGTSIGTLVEMILRIAKQPERRVITTTAPPPRPSVIILDPTKIYREIGWRARISLEKGLKPLVEQRINIRYA